MNKEYIIKLNKKIGPNLILRKTCSKLFINLDDKIIILSFKDIIFISRSFAHQLNYEIINRDKEVKCMYVNSFIGKMLDLFNIKYKID